MTLSASDLPRASCLQASLPGVCSQPQPPGHPVLLLRGHPVLFNRKVESRVNYLSLYVGVILICRYVYGDY